MKKFLFLVLFIAGHSTFSQSQEVVVDNDIQNEEIEISTAIKQSEPIVEYGRNNIVTTYETLKVRKSNNQDNNIFQTQSMSIPLVYWGNIKIDDDGVGFWHNDPDHDSETSLKRNNESLNADTDAYIVAPRWLLLKGVKVGDRADVTAYVAEKNDVNLKSDPDSPCWSYSYKIEISSVVGDIGPYADQVGEVSVKAAQDLGFIIEDVDGTGPVPIYYKDYKDGTTHFSSIKVTYYPSGC